MAIVKIDTIIEGNIDKYDAYRALCEDVGLEMLVNRTGKEHTIENGKLYRTYDESYHGSPSMVRELVTEDVRQVMLFENLLAIKCIL